MGEAPKLGAAQPEVQQGASGQKLPGKSASKSNSKSTSKNTADAHSKSKSQKQAQARAEYSRVDVDSDRYPYCVVWTPLPIISWFVPIIGHTGIASSTGIIYDFSDDFNVTVNNFSFGTPTKYYQFRREDIPHGAEAWDKAIQETSDYYSRTRHSLFFNNCHQYIAGVLNKVAYGNKTNWTQTDVWWRITFQSRYTGFLGFIRQWWPISVMTSAAIVFIIVTFMVGARENVEH